MPATQRGRHRHSSWPQAGQPGIGAHIAAGAVVPVEAAKEVPKELIDALNGTRLLDLPSAAVVMPFQQEQAMGYLRSEV
jgi:hypothetical protein